MGYSLPQFQGALQNASMIGYRPNVPLLALCQALMMSGNSLMVTSAALVGFALAEDKSLATLPLAAQFLATMLTSAPASLLMGQIGRKPAFLLATVIGAGGAILATHAIIIGSFWQFCAGAALSGAFNGFGNYYRFAAAEVVAPNKRARAISAVMAGGVLAAFIGPNLANWAQNLITDARFAGGFAAVVGLQVIAATALLFTRLEKPGQQQVQGEARPLLVIARQPRFVVAVVCAMLGYGVMSLVMTATPLAMQHHQHPFGDTAFVIQWHVLGMFAPSFFTGRLIERFGVSNILLIGGLLGAACLGINLYGQSLWHFWLALFALGVSWNFLFIGGTTLLTETHSAAEKPKVQALNDSLVFTTVTLASLSAGALQHSFGWQAVNQGVLLPVTAILIAVMWLKLRTERATAAA
jgi:MFS family permease